MLVTCKDTVYLLPLVTQLPINKRMFFAHYLIAIVNTTYEYILSIVCTYNTCFRIYWCLSLFISVKYIAANYKSLFKCTTADHSYVLKTGKIYILNNKNINLWRFFNFWYFITEACIQKWSEGIYVLNSIPLPR